MNVKLLLGLVLILSISCKENTKKNTKKAVVTEVKINYPEALQKVFDAHGGIAAWKTKNSLGFEIIKENGNEVYLLDLKSRNELIAGTDYTIGKHKGKVWLENTANNYKGRPRFYSNLMFYFYAMPFVLSDDGIVYEEALPLTVAGIAYPGLKISFKSGVGESDKDDYYLHYNPDTYKMEWLGYTMTYFSKEKGKKVNWIKYNDWTTIGGVALPKSITWHNYEGRKIGEAKDTLQFLTTRLDDVRMDMSVFEMPKSASIVEE